MTSTAVGNVIKSVGPKLVPFFKTLAIYFVVFPSPENPSFLSAIVKCLPIVSLMIFVLLHGMNLSDEYKYARGILIGLIFCCLGDAFLIWHQYFEFGMVAFAIGHIYYILTFGFKPFNAKLGIGLYAISGLGVLYLLPGLKGILVIAVPIYTFIVATMVWRAISRVQIDDGLWSWSKICSCAGAILFAISDFTLGYDKFRYSLNHSQLAIMSTYYAAQLGIALSIVDAKSKSQ